MKTIKRSWACLGLASLLSLLVASTIVSINRGVWRRPTADVPAICVDKPVDELASSIIQNSDRDQSIDFKPIFAGGTQALIFGEAHIAISHRAELIGSLAQLKAAGATHLVLEALPSSKQDLYLAYRAKLISRDQLVEEIHHALGWQPASYADLIDAAISNGLGVVFMDADDDKTIDDKSPEWIEKTNWIVKNDRRRESHWVQVIDALSRSYPGARPVVLVGSLHTEAREGRVPLQQQLAAIGIKNSVITLEGGDPFYRSLVTEAARQAHFDRTRFVLKSDPACSPTQAIYHIHLPQAGEPLL